MLVSTIQRKGFFYKKNFQNILPALENKLLPSKNINKTPPYTRQAFMYVSPSAEHCPFEEQLCCWHFKISQDSPVQWLSQRHWPITHCPWPVQSLDTQSGSWAHTIVDTFLAQVNSPLKRTRDNSQWGIISSTCTSNNSDSSKPVITITL